MSDDPTRPGALGYTTDQLEDRAQASLAVTGLVQQALSMVVGERPSPSLIDAQQLETLCPHAKLDLLRSLATAMNAFFPEFGITTPLRICHFMAQAAEETDGLHTLHEYATGAKYEHRRDLGNVKPGDGKRYKGRGIFQLTGRANYRVYGALISAPLEDYPELAALPQMSVLVSCHYWKKKKIAVAADHDNVVRVTKLVNGGHRGLEVRKQYLAKAKKIWR
jgi:putative chitinase